MSKLSALSPGTADQPQSGPRPSPADSDPAVESLALDEVFDLLRNERRRSVLRYFLERDCSVATLGDLAEYAAAREFETTVPELTATERKRVYVGLYQCHLPRMDEAGVVEFDDDHKTVTLGPNADVLRSYLEDTDPDGEAAPRRDRRYLAVAVCGAALFALAELGGAAAGLTPRVVLAGVLVAVTALALTARR